MMRGVVTAISGPEPILTPADIPGDHAGDDPVIAGWIAAAQSMVDGPNATICNGRAFGIQTLEWDAPSYADGDHVPFPPLIEIESVLAAPNGRSLVQFRAGYDGEPVDNGGTGPIPEAAKIAVKLLVKDLMMAAEIDTTALRSESVDGIGQVSYMDVDKISRMTASAAVALLRGYRVYRP